MTLVEVITQARDRMAADSRLGYYTAIAADSGELAGRAQMIVSDALTSFQRSNPRNRGLHSKAARRYVWDNALNAAAKAEQNAPSLTVKHSCDNGNHLSQLPVNAAIEARDSEAARLAREEGSV